MSNYEFWDELGKIFNAVVAYQEKTVEFNKRFINPWIRLGNVFDKQDRNEEAVDAYQKALEIDPKNAQNWYEVGNIHFRMGKYEEAIGAFNQAIQLDPGFGWPYSNLALTYVSQGKFVEAIPLYRQSIDLLTEDKDKAVSWNRLGNVYRKLNEYEQAVDAFQRADELDQENAGFRDNLDEQSAAPTVVEADSENSDPAATPLMVSLNELIPVDETLEGSNQAATEVEASTDNASITQIEEVSEQTEVTQDTSVDAIDSQPVANDLEPAVTAPEEVIDEPSDVPQAEEQVPDILVEASNEVTVENEASESQPAAVDADTFIAPESDEVDTLSDAPELEQPVVEVLAEVSDEAAAVNQASDSQPAVVDAEAPAMVRVDEANETNNLTEADALVLENSVEVPQEPIAETVAASVEEVAIVSEQTADAGPEATAETTNEAIAADETVTIVVQSTVETFTENVAVSDTATETSDAALTVEMTEEAVSEPVAEIEELVVESAVQTLEAESTVADVPVVDETIPAETPSLEVAEVETANVEIQPDAEETVVVVTEIVSEVEASVDPETTLNVQATDQPATEQPAYEEFLKDNNDPIQIYESGSPEDAAPVESENEAASPEPIAKIDAAGDVQIEMDTKNAHVWNELGNVYFNTGAFDDAVIAYSKAIELDRWFAWPYSNLALTYVQKGRFVEAILLYQRSIELFTGEKDKAISWNRLGNVYRRINDYENAIAAYQRADELDPDNTSLSLQSRFSLLGSYVMEQKPSYVS